MKQIDFRLVAARLVAGPLFPLVGSVGVEDDSPGALSR